MPESWPFERTPGFSSVHAPNLASAWTDSSKRIRQIQSTIGSCLPEFVACIAVSGSLARMESHSGSDIDLIVVIDDRTADVSAEDAATVFSAIWDRLDTINAIPPKPGGIFSVCARWKGLIDPAVRGRIDESTTTFGHRIQLLIDAQPVFAPETFTELRRDILSWYSEHHLARIFDEPGSLHWLWQDVQRYWRSLRSRTCWVHADDRAKSLLLNVKLRSSRLALVYAFLKSIETAHESAPGDAIIPAMLDSLHQTPLERLFGDDSDTSRVGCTACDTIWTFLRDHAHTDVRDLPDQIGNALKTLSESVVASIALRAHDQPDHWFL